MDGDISAELHTPQSYLFPIIFQSLLASRCIMVRTLNLGGVLSEKECVMSKRVFFTVVVLLAMGVGAVMMINRPNIPTTATIPELVVTPRVQSLPLGVPEPLAKLISSEPDYLLPPNMEMPAFYPPSAELQGVTLIADIAIEADYEMYPTFRTPKMGF